MKNLSKKLIAIVSIIILTLLAGTIFTEAKTLNSLSSLLNGKNIGNKVYIGRLQGVSNLYCVQQPAHFMSGDFQVTRYIKIEGNKATNDKGKTVTHKSNAVLAYMLGGGSNSTYGSGEGEASNGYSLRQRAIWRHMDVWRGNVGKRLGINWQNGGGTLRDPGDLITKAKNYANGNDSNYQPASIDGNQTIISSNTMVGPLSAKFVGKISSITLTDSNGKTISGIKFYKDKNGKNEIALKDIKSKQKFYAKNTTNRNVKQIKITVKGGNTINAELWFLKKTISSSGIQRLMYVKTSTKPSEASKIITVKTTGSIIAYKYDEDEPNKVPANSLGGVVYKVRIGSSANWLGINSNGTWNYSATFKNAKTFTTKKGQGVAIQNLLYGTYRFYEVGAPSGYTLEKQKGYDKTNKWVYAGAAKVLEGDRNITITQRNIKAGSLVINKKGSKGEKLVAGFIIKTESGWLSGEGTTAKPYKYNNALGKAEIYQTKNGQKVLSKLNLGKYTVYEVSAPQGYELSSQNGYNKSGNNGKGWVEFGEKDLTATTPSRTIKYDLVNVKKISISGLVFVDIAPPTKAQKDKIYTPDLDKLVDNVKVELVNKKTGKVKATTVTSNGGRYTFNNQISANELTNYFVRFNYAGTEYKQYIPVEFNAIANGSKALVAEMPTADKDFKAIATTYSGSTAKQESNYGLSGLYKTLGNSETLNNINLGITEPNDPKYQIKNDLESVRISINGYTYTYLYGKEENKTYVAAPKVKWQSLPTYTRAIYPADIVYDPQNKDDELKVFVKYRIAITNTEETNIDYIYQEKALHVTSLINTFDNKRYTMVESDIWKLDGNNKAVMNPDKLKEIYGTIGKTETKVSNIEFRVNENAIKDILNHPDGIIEDKNMPTKATAKAYHEYTREKDYSWKNNIVAKQTHTSIEKEASSDAPYLRFIMGDERIVSGKVFEDKVVSTNGEKLGNGKYDENENILSGVKVELFTANNQIATVYPKEYIVDGNGKKLDRTIPQQGTIKTSKDGSYKIRGLVPGDYYLKFTYGDGTQKICDLNGNEIKDVSAKNYKSTIITSEAAKNVLKNGANIQATKFIWYKDANILSGNYSVAIDDLNTRIAVNNNSGNTITANTAKISITIENTEGDSIYLLTEEEVNNSKGKLIEAIRTYGGFNFGIIEVPMQDATIEKIITNIEMVNEAGNQIFSGNPVEDAMPGVTDLSNPKNRAGSTFTRAEVLQENLYASRVIVTYRLKVTNTSDVNYATDGYYFYGEDKNNEIALKPEVIDYLPESLIYQQEKSDKDKIEVIQETNAQGITSESYKLKNIGTLYSIKNDARKTDNKTSSSDTVKLTASRKTPGADDDMEYVNVAKVTKLETVGENLNKVAMGIREDNREAKATLTITPPTGKDKLIIAMYILVGAVALAILSTGIVVIKKKVV